MTDLVLVGALTHAPLLGIVLGRTFISAAADLAGFALDRTDAHDDALVLPVGQGEVPCCVLKGATAQDIARVSYFYADTGCRLSDVRLSDGRHLRMLARPRVDAGADPRQPWCLDGWEAAHAPLAIAVAQDAMAWFGQVPGREVWARAPMMRVRAASRLRAQAEAAAGDVLRRTAASGDVTAIARRQPYGHFFAVEEYDLHHSRFDGTRSGVINRAAFVSGDAATVLPYDPRRDRVMVIEQFRTGPYARGDVNPWLLEPIAGRVDPDETPEQTARREAMEEAGVSLGALLPIANYYPSPGAKSEFLYCYLGIADLPVLGSGLGGLAEEHEDIRAHVIGFDDLMQVATMPEGATGPLIVSALWLAANRDRLRAGM